MRSERVPFTGIQFHCTVRFKQVEFEGIADLDESDTAVPKQLLRLTEALKETWVLHGFFPAHVVTALLCRHQISECCIRITAAREMLSQAAYDLAGDANIVRYSAVNEHVTA